MSCGTSTSSRTLAALLVMPAVLKACPNAGAPGEQRRVQMAEGMQVVLSGSASTLADLLPCDVTRDSAGHIAAPLQLLLHLVLPVMLISGRAEGLSIAGYMVGPQRLGVALDIILRVYRVAQARILRRGDEGRVGRVTLVTGDLPEELFTELEELEARDTEHGEVRVTPLSVAVAREVCSRIGAYLRAKNDLPFMVRPEDLISLDNQAEPAEADEFGEVGELLFPTWCGELTFAMLRSTNGTLGPLADLEPLLNPRYTARDRVNYTSAEDEQGATVKTYLEQGAFYRLARLLLVLETAEEREVISSLDLVDQAKAHAAALCALLPVPNEVRVYPRSSGEAQLGLVRYLKRAGSTGLAGGITPAEVLNAVTFFPVVELVIGGDMSAAAAMSVISDLARAVGLRYSAATFDVGLLGAIEAALEHLGAVVQRAVDSGMPASGIVALIAKEDASTAAMTSAAPRGGGGGAGGEHGSGTGGYPASSMADLRKHITTESFLAAVAALEGMRARGAEPLVVVRYVFASRQAIFLQALLGHKHNVPAVPITDWLIRVIRVAVPQALSDLLSECATPAPPPGVLRVRAPPAVELFASLCKGDLNIDWENEMYWILAFCGVNASRGLYEVVPEQQVYTDVGRFTRLSRVLVPFLDALGWDSMQPPRQNGQACSLATVMATVLDYVEAAASVDARTLGLVMRRTLQGVLAERSVDLKHFLLFAQPSSLLDTALVVENSPAMRNLQELRVQVPRQNELQRELLVALGPEAMAKMGIGRALVPPGIIPVAQAAAPKVSFASPDPAAAAATTAAAAAEAAEKKLAAAEKKLAAGSAAKSALAERAGEKRDVAVGALHPAFVREVAGGVQFGRKDEPDKLQFVDREAFKAVAGHDACIGVWMSSSTRHPHAMCTHPRKKGCETATSVNHVVPALFRRNHRAGLLQAVVLAAALGAQPAAQADAALVRGGRAAGWHAAHGGRAQAAGGSAMVAWGAAVDVGAARQGYSAGVLPDATCGVQDGASWYGPAAAAQPQAAGAVPCSEVAEMELKGGYVFMPVLHMAPDGPYVALPAGSDGAVCYGSAAIGQAVTAGERREEGLSLASAWAEEMYPGRGDLCAFGFFRDTDRASAEVAGLIASDPLPPGALTRRVSGVDGLRGMPGDGPVWVAVSGLLGTPCERLATLCAARAGSFCWPAPDFTTTGATVGVLAPSRCTPLEPTGGLAGRCTSLSPGELKEACDEATLTLKEVFARAAAGLSGLSEAGKAAAGKWLPSVTPVCWADVPKGAIGLASKCNYAPLTKVPWPAWVRTVSSSHCPELPPKPPPGLIPNSARGWRDVLRPGAYTLVLAWMTRVEGALRAMVRGAGVEELRHLMPKALALGFDSLEPWAAAAVGAGHVLQTNAEGGLELKDLSQPPPTHFNRAQWQAMFDENGSKDLALQDVVKNGITYLSKAPGAARYLAPAPNEAVLLLQPSLRSFLADQAGFLKAHEALSKMEKRGWFELVRMHGLGGGEFLLPSIPWRTNANGMVIKANGRDWRGICDYGSPHDDTLRITVLRDGVFVAEGPVVASLNTNCSVRSSKAVRAAEGDGRASMAVRHTPAMRRGREPYGERDGWVAGPRRFEPTPLPPSPPSTPSPPSPPPSKMELRVAAGTCGADWDKWLYPGEYKPFFTDVLLAIAQMCNIGEKVGMPCVILGDDAEAFFHQWALAAQQEWMCGGLRLDPDALRAGELDAALTAVRERCMAMGVQPSSNWAQRALTEITHCLTRRFAEAEEPHWAQLEVDFPAFGEWRDERRKLSATTGRDEARCMYSTGYTDDVVTLVLGAEAALRYVCLHEELLGSGGLNVLMASEEKRSLGVSAPFIGANVLTVGGIGYLGPAKVHSTLEVLALAIEGNLTLARFVRLAGMLNHLVIILSLPYKEMYAVYGMLDRTRSLGRGLDELVECTDAGVASLGRFRDGLLGTAGVSAMASVFPMLPAVDGGVVNVMHSDAAIKGTGNPALAGNLGLTSISSCGTSA